MVTVIRSAYLVEHETHTSYDPAFDVASEYEYAEALADDKDGVLGIKTFALLEFESPVIVPPSAIVIGSKLDMDAAANSCRLAFHGAMVLTSTDPEYAHNLLPTLKIFKVRTCL